MEDCLHILFGSDDVEVRYETFFWSLLVDEMIAFCPRLFEANWWIEKVQSIIAIAEGGAKTPIANRYTYTLFNETTN